MKLTYVCADGGISLCGVKGASAHLRSLSGALARRGNEVVVACRRLDGPNEIPEGVTAVELDRDSTLERLREMFVRLGTEAVLERYSLEGGSALRAANALGLPYLLEVNAPLADEAARYRRLEDVELWRRREAELFRSAGRILAVSTAIRDHVVAAGAAPDAVTVVPNGVDVAQFARRRRSLRGAGPEGEYVVGFVGSLKPWHGVDILLEAFAGLLGDVRLLIVGDGPERARLEEMAGNLGISERTIFAGAVPQGEVPRWLEKMHVGVAPYSSQPVFYFSPLKIAEYLAAGLPVVASDQGDVASLVEGAALLVRPGDPAALRHALRTLQSDAALRARLAANARERASGLDWDNVAAKVESLVKATGIRV